MNNITIDDVICLDFGVGVVTAINIGFASVKITSLSLPCDYKVGDVLIIHVSDLGVI